MKRMVSLAAGVAVGYVLGSRAGREKYEQIAATARRYAGQLPAGETVSDTGPSNATAAGKDPTATRRARPSRARTASDVIQDASGTRVTAKGTRSAGETERSAAGTKRSVTETEREELRVAAKERVEDMPGETALGNPDPAAGGHGDPKTYQGN